MWEWCSRRKAKLSATACVPTGNKSYRTGMIVDKCERSFSPAYMQGNAMNRSLNTHTHTRGTFCFQCEGSPWERPLENVFRQHVVSVSGRIWQTSSCQSTAVGCGESGRMNGKNVCTVHVYRKSVIKTYQGAPCRDPANCYGLRTYSAPVATREVCCRGWETTTTVADGCFKPICQTPCRNGGRCTAPDRCTCPAGFTGKYCELDVNECKEHKPCDQTCYNTEGSYYCTCRDGFMLQSDRQTCKKIDETNDLATEARDMENDLDVDYDSLDIRLRKLEQLMASRDDRQELTKKVQYTMDAVSVLKSQVARLNQRLFPPVDYGNRVH
uniref:epidermal growth factor-like protein 7 isoform X2 n=1 Tax=Anopheles coluzzii TaxID=1518534 RepID=UPI0020FFC828|nr:epidermal growth factor-like protein 7 isoform X2 [Anopheles coluzzii]